jgi:hypothetical protein
MKVPQRNVFTASPEMPITADTLGLLDQVRQRAAEFAMPFEAALRQALLMYLRDSPVSESNHNSASLPARP